MELNEGLAEFLDRRDGASGAERLDGMSSLPPLVGEGQPSLNLGHDAYQSFSISWLPFIVMIRMHQGRPCSMRIYHSKSWARLRQAVPG